MSYRTHQCGELRLSHAGQAVTLAGWVAKNRDFGGLTFIDLRDRYGITQLSFNETVNKNLQALAQDLGREFVIQAKGIVRERESKNKHIPTGEIEIEMTDFTILNPSAVPPFTIEDETDGGEEIRMQYRYLDIRRNPVREKLILRHQLAQKVRSYLSNEGFIEVETPVLIKSTPEGARDFVVPSRMNQGQFYALPQSPQTFKQLLMVGGMDKYFQLVKCFRDEDLRADRQPEFTQIDCEMCFVEQDDILNLFEGMMHAILKDIKGQDVGNFPRITFAEAMYLYGNDKPDIRFDMQFQYLKGGNDNLDLVAGHGFNVFETAPAVLAINAKGAAEFTRKQIDQLTDWVKRPQIGAKGLIYCRVGKLGEHKSSVDKYYDQTALQKWVEACNAAEGDLILIISGDLKPAQTQMSALRLEMAAQLGLKNPNVFKPLWVIDFPLLEWNEQSNRFHAMHHPFTSPKPEDLTLINTDPGKVRANAYDMVVNGVELGGGSIRIHDTELQSAMFDALGFSKEEAQAQFGFLLNAFKYGAPPHGGLAFGFDRMCALLGGSDSIRDFIAFPKNNMGRDVMIDAPAAIDANQLKELGLNI